MIWGTSSNIAKLERLISGLGSLPAHGPPLLAWTLSTYLAKGQEGLGKAARLGTNSAVFRILIRIKKDRPDPHG